jgi:hypothetical protein
VDASPDLARPVHRRLRIALAAGALAAAVAGGFAGCQAFGGRPGGDPAPNAVHSFPAGLPCLGTCVPDPGSRPVDCSAASGIETLPISRFDQLDIVTGFRLAADFYAYSDGTAQTYDVFSTATSLGSEPTGYQPHTQEVDLCGPSNFALHVTGGYQPADTSQIDAACPQFVPAAGAYRGYGGGIGIAMQKLNDDNRGGPNLHGDPNGYCGANSPDPRPDVCPPADAEYAVGVAALDVSAYDGVSFWARRGPNGQEAVGVTVGDKFTDDDLSFLTYMNDPAAPRHCERVRQCACSNLKPCLFESPPPSCAPPLVVAPDAGAFPFYCMPLDRVLYQSINGGGSNLNCDVAECNVPYPAYPAFPDPAFNNRPCTPYAWANGVGSSYCFDPATDPLPADPTQQCGDHWMKMVDLDTDWHFYKIAFTDLRQQGFGKKSEQLDLHSVSVVRFTWTAGWIDYFIDDVGFYRNPR